MDEAEKGLQADKIGRKQCGVVRPISNSDSYTSLHWEEVGGIIDSAVQLAGFDPRLVSDGNSTGIIHARIVGNLYQDPIVVCDISGKNANVMLELGMRLAFDKPVVVVKDDLTNYSFDTSPIEHLTYPASLHYPRIVEFKKMLAEKISATCDGFDSSRSFLQQFGPIKVAKIEEVAVPGFELVREEIRELRLMLQSARNQSIPAEATKMLATPASSLLIFKKRLPESLIEEVRIKASKLNSVDKITITLNDRGMLVRIKPDRLGGWDQHEANEAVRSLLREYLKDIPLP